MPHAMYRLAGKVKTTDLDVSDSVEHAQHAAHILDKCDSIVRLKLPVAMSTPQNDRLCSSRTTACRTTQPVQTVCLSDRGMFASVHLEQRALCFVAELVHGRIQLRESSALSHSHIAQTSSVRIGRWRT